MSFTYSLESLKLTEDTPSSIIAKVRLRTGLKSIQDVIQISDEEILFLHNGDIDETAIKVIESVLPTAAQYTDRKTGEVEEDLSQVYDNLRKLLDDLKDIMGKRVPINIKATGLDAVEYQEGQLDEEVFHGFRSCDKGPLE